MEHLLPPVFVWFFGFYFSDRCEYVHTSDKLDGKSREMDDRKRTVSAPQCEKQKNFYSVYYAVREKKIDWQMVNWSERKSNE